MKYMTSHMMNRQEFFAWARKSMDLRYSTEQLYMAYESYLICPLARAIQEEGATAAGCLRCGNCCRRQWKVEASLNDVLRWIGEGRTDILESLECNDSSCGMRENDWGSGTVARHIAERAAVYGEDILAVALRIARTTTINGGYVVMPKEQGCKYLIGGKTVACSIYETRPEVCRNFPNAGGWP